MSGSVRTRLAIGVGAVGAVAFALLAVIAPGLIRTSLEDDALRTEAASIDGVLSFVYDDDFTGDVDDGTIVETELVGVVTDRDQYLELQLTILEDTGRIDDIVETAGGPFVLAYDAEIAVLVDEQGAIVEQLDGPDDVDLPVLASDELDQYLFDDLGYVVVDADTIVQTGDGRIVQRTVSFDGTDYIVAIDATAIDTSVDDIGRLLWILVPVGALLLGGLGALLAARALRPVADIRDRAATITAGTLDERVPVPATGDEIAELAQTVNDMLDRIDDDDRRRRRFVSDASHELRTPIAVIRNDAEVALAHPDQVPTAELAGTVADESRRLSAIIDDLLALARHDERAAVELGDVDLDELVLAESERTRRVPVVTTAVSAGRISGVPSDLARLIGHLLDNAARHAGTRVEVGLDTHGDRVVLQVDDDGPGIAPEHRDAVFERFTRLDEARTRDGGGAGLGLAVVREITHRCGGTVVVEDAPIGGARFVLRFPAA